MPVKSSRTRSNSALTCPRIAGIQNDARMFTEQLQGSTIPDDRRQQRILDFYSRKTVAQRHAPHPATDSTIPPPLRPRSAHRRPELTSFIHNDSNHLLVPFPSGRHGNQDIRSPWSLRPSSGISNEIINNTNHATPDVGVRNIFEPVGGIVLLQPLVAGVQGSQTRELQAPLPPSFTSMQGHHRVARSITLQETFVPVNSESFFVNPQMASDTSGNSESECESDQDSDNEDEVKAPDVFAYDTTCTICSGIFRDPRILGCGHTFCLRCLVRMHRRSRREEPLSCPVCRGRTFVPSADLKLLTKNFAVKNLVETIRITSKNEKSFMSQMKQSSDKDLPSDIKMSASKELKESKCFPLREGRVTGLELMKHKMYLAFERSSSLQVVSTRTSFVGPSKREEVIFMEGIVNPIGVASRQAKNLLFILDSPIGKSHFGIYKSSVWKVTLPDGKTKKWTESLQTGESMSTSSDGLMVVLLVLQDGKHSINFYPSENDFGEVARKISISGLGHPVHFCALSGGSEIALSYVTGTSDGGSSKILEMRVVDLDGRILRSTRLGSVDQSVRLASDETKNLYFVADRKNHITRIDRGLKDFLDLRLKDAPSNGPRFVRLVNEGRFIVCFDKKLCIYEG